MEDWKNDFWSCEKSESRERKSSSVVTKRRYPDGIGILRISFSSPHPEGNMINFWLLIGGMGSYFWDEITSLYT